MLETTDAPKTGSLYTVQTPVFEGPLDVLLSLIEKRKLFINDIALAHVTDDFIRYIQEQSDFPLEESSHFIFIASTLLLIKSKSLLPTLTLTEEEEESVEELERRLKLYKNLRDRAGELRSSWCTAPLFFGKGETLVEPSFRPDKGITPEALLQEAEAILQGFPSEDSLPQTSVRETVKLETVIQSLIGRIQNEVQMSFREFSGLAGSGGQLRREERIQVVVSFIAVLELVKQGTLSAHQENHTEDIRIEGTEVSTPHYL